jgi:preprotein translocase subunit SecD
VKPLALAVASILVVSGLACANDSPNSDVPPSQGAEPAELRIVMKPEAAQPGGAVPEQVMSSLVDVINQRLVALKLRGEIEEIGEDHFTFRVSGVLDQDRIVEAISGTGALDFREPKLTDDIPPQIACAAVDGTEFRVTRDQAIERTRTDGKQEVRCTGSAGETGTVVWLPATGEVGGEAWTLTGVFLDRREVRVLTLGVEGCPSEACVAISFAGRGFPIFEQVTTRLSLNQMPLAIFLDENLIGAPTVVAPITEGRSLITGLEVDEAETLSIYLKEGALPIPVSVVSTEELP